MCSHGPLTREQIRAVLDEQRAVGRRQRERDLEVAELERLRRVEERRRRRGG